MDPLSITALGLGGLSKLYGLGQGISQKAQAKKIEKEIGDRPEYRMPGQVSRATALAEVAYKDPRMPGADLTKAEMDAALSDSLSRGASIAPTAGAYAQMISSGLRGQQQQLASLAVQSAQQQERDRMALQRSLNIEAQYADREWERNLYEPWMQGAAAASALRQAGSSNIYRGLKNTGAAVAKIAPMLSKKEPEYYYPGIENDLITDAITSAFDAVGEQPDYRIPQFELDPLYGLK